MLDEWITNIRPRGIMRYNGKSDFIKVSQKFPSWAKCTSRRETRKHRTDKQKKKNKCRHPLLKFYLLLDDKT